MNHEVMLAQPLAAVFGHLAAPSRLADWLPEVTGVQADDGQPAGIGITFGLRLRHGGRDIRGSGELIGYEPPWSLAYRLVAGPHTYVLRLTCVSTDDSTRVRVRQADGAVPLAVDLGRLPELIGVAAGPQAAGGDPCGSRS
jgi:Polyketide cyclase / dehydrase and lipid transport